MLDGFHAHCPRNCCNYVRDKDVHELHKLLDGSGEPWRANALSENMQQRNSNETCDVQVKRDENADEGPCEEPLCIDAGPAKLCKKHYKEYLAALIRHYNVEVPDKPCLGAQP